MSNILSKLWKRIIKLCSINVVVGFELNNHTTLLKHSIIRVLINILRIKVYKTMEALGVIWEVAKCLFSCTNAQAAYIYKLQENLESLNKKWDDLQNKEKDVLTKIDKDESTGVMKRTNEGIGWLQEFQTLQEVILSSRWWLKVSRALIRGMGFYCFPSFYVSNFGYCCCSPMVDELF
ncbi:hypothetical protein MtrunA17_Chr6g0478711 [Medicago truncatula]|uniref:Uncharacterized protein n=1 Tax=Medicago truncatula TaxID=3880 RepID=A0A396HK80_MEDTR|nr:hypothetical protein MtrunA17_Chr6g0478711 [Medicago truncatula]